jgi:ABC-type uncharacterized transport system involved in gliding motility auxiliary subunit
MRLKMYFAICRLISEPIETGQQLLVATIIVHILMYLVTLTVMHGCDHWECLLTFVNLAFISLALKVYFAFCWSPFEPNWVIQIATHSAHYCAHSNHTRRFVDLVLPSKTDR